MKIDKTDVKILEILQENGKISNAELAKRIGISPPPTLDRVKKLENSGVIKKYVAMINPESVGIETFTFVQVVLRRHGREVIKEFVDEVVKIKEVMACHHITGDADFLLKIAVKRIPAYEKLVLDKLTELPHIQHLKTMVVLSTIKNETSFNINNGIEDE